MPIHGLVKELSWVLDDPPHIQNSYHPLLSLLPKEGLHPTPTHQWSPQATADHHWIRPLLASPHSTPFLFPVLLQMTCPSPW
jgi:hypothetical protein